MKFVFNKLIIIVVILFIFSSCKTTGDFTISKRRYNKGFHLETPSVTNNAHSASNKKVSSKAKIVSKEITPESNDDNYLASVYSNPNIAVNGPARSTTTINTASSHQNKIQSYTKKFSGKKALKTKTIKSITHDSIPIKKNRTVSLIGFYSCCIAYLGLPLELTGIAGSLTVFGMVTGFILFLAPISAIVFGLIGLHKIKKNPEKYDGKKFAKIALYGGIVYYVLLIIWAIIFVSLTT